jgi:UDP-N-acetylglucosamine 2-epimerase (non-hydrolysing)
VAHVEAGLRSFDRSMPEESNRVVTDALSQWLFASEREALENLTREGVPAARVHLVGNVMIDTLLAHRERARAAQPFARYGLREQGYALLTLHRPSNVDDPVRLRSILAAVHEISRELPVLFPVHPRTAAKLSGFGFEGDPALNGYQRTEPIGYLEMLGLMDSARIVLTDSGGVQEETTALGVPCLTLRENTERPVTIACGTNQLVGWRTDRIVQAVRDVLNGVERPARIPDLWDGHAAKRIADILRAELCH